MGQVGINNVAFKHSMSGTELGSFGKALQSARTSTNARVKLLAAAHKAGDTKGRAKIIESLLVGDDARLVSAIRANQKLPAKRRRLARGLHRGRPLPRPVEAVEGARQGPAQEQEERLPDHSRPRPEAPDRPGPGEAGDGRRVRPAPVPVHPSRDSTRRSSRRRRSSTPATSTPPISTSRTSTAASNWRSCCPSCPSPRRWWSTPSLDGTWRRPGTWST